MPFYEYECRACKYYTEVMQKLTDAPLIKCPSCGKRTLKKLVSAPVFRLKGGGWYETDFKSDQESKRNLLGPDKEEAKPADTKEPKPEAKEAKEAPAPTGAQAEAPKSPAAAKAAGAARTGVGVPAKPIRSGPARRPGRSGARRGAARRRR